MGIVIGTDWRVVITGATGTGKTTLVKSLLLPAIPHTQTRIVIDPKRDKRWKDIPSIQTRTLGRFSTLTWEPRSLRAFRWNGTPTNLAEDASFTKLVQTAFEEGNTSLIVDETSALFPAAHTMTPIMGRVIREGRDRNVSIWWLVQRPVDVPGIILSEAEGWAVFTLRNHDDRRRVAGYVGDAVSKPLPQETGRSHYFWWSAPGNNQPTLMRLKLGKNGQAK